MSPAAATAWLWDRLRRPFDEVQVTQALLGVDEVAARHLLARLVLDSPEARALLEATPTLIRLLRNQQGTLVRTEPSIRGPVLWNATVAHRAASGFQDDLYVCAMAVRDYDVAENRALAAALLALRRAGRQLGALPGSPPDDGHGALLARARRAGTVGSHPRLRGVATGRPTARDLAKIRSGPARVAYEPAVAVLERLAEGPRLEELSPFVDRRHAAHHELLRLVITEVERTGALLEPVRTWRGQLFTGRIRYLPPGELGAGAAAGVAVGDVVFALPEPWDTDDAGASVAARHRGHRVIVVTGHDDVRRVLDPRHAPAGTPGDGRDAVVSTARR